MGNKSFNTILIVLIILVVIFGLGYNFWYLPQKAAQSTNKPYENQLDLNIFSGSQDNVTAQVYKNTTAGYSVSYPSNWTVGAKAEEQTYSNFQLQNNPDAVIPGANTSLRANDSIIHIDVSYGVLENGINYSDYKTIADVIKDPKFGLTNGEEGKQRLNSIVTMTIGGKNLSVMKLNNATAESLTFVDSGKVYSMDIMSGSENQYAIDHPVFEQIVSSFVLELTATATINENILEKRKWGVVFEKSSDWDIVSNTDSEVSLIQMSGDDKGDTMTINYTSGKDVTTTDAKFGNLTYFYDNAKKAWMKKGTAVDEGNETSGLAVPAQELADTGNKNFTVFKGTRRWLTYVVPLSHTTFLNMNITGSGNTQALKDLFKTLKLTQ